MDMAIRRTDFFKLRKFKQNTYEKLFQTLMLANCQALVARFYCRRGRKKEAILCLPLFMFIKQYKKSIESFAHSWHSLGNFLESKIRNVVVS